MAEEILPPFSARIRGMHAQIDNDFPETARTGLLHILYRLVSSRYVEGWDEVTVELQRIARVRPDIDRYSRAKAEEILLTHLPWEKVFDFCERLHGYLAKSVEYFDQDQVETVETLSRSDAQTFIANELQRLFLEERIAFEFSNGAVRRRGRRNMADKVGRAELVLGDPRLPSARTHFTKALKYFRIVSQPDYENAIKEAICAVEATARALFPSGGSTLGAVVNSITGADVGQLPTSIAKTFHGLYGFGNGGQGVRHGGAEGGPVTKELAEYSLALASSQIVLLVDLAAMSESDIPF